MSKKLKKKLRKIIVGAICFTGAVVLDKAVPGVNANLILIAYLLAYIIIGGDVVKKAAVNITHGQVFDENFLMMIATVGAFFIGEYPEAVAVMLFYQVGEWFQSYAVDKSRKSISALMDIRPDYANVIRDGETLEVSPEEVKVGETILIRAGERVPLDGRIIKGNTSLDTMALTGESLPNQAGEGDEVISGCINITGVIEVEVEKEFGQSTVARILDLVENASSKKAESENFISKFAKYYTPIVVFAALFIAILPPLILGEAFGGWIYRALTFLVVSCPCALVISIPLSFFGGIGGASKEGILIKGSNYLEALAKTEVIVMDKTGTLTKGSFGVEQIETVSGSGVSKEELLELAGYAESLSNHPISKSIQDAYLKQAGISEFIQEKVQDVEEIAGFGVKVQMNDSTVWAGSGRLMEKAEIAYSKVDDAGTVVHIARDDKYLGYILVADEIKPDSKKAIEGFYEAGIRDVVMLTGDRNEVAQKVAKELGIKKVYAQLLPADKVDKVEQIFTEKSEEGKLVFVGDGINDAPVLARADIGVAMGGLGQDAAIEAADVVIMTDEPSKISTAIKISKKTLRIVKQNIIFAIGVKILVLILAAFGMANMWMAVFADVGVSVIAILNAMRALKLPKQV